MIEGQEKDSIWNEFKDLNLTTEESALSALVNKMTTTVQQDPTIGYFFGNFCENIPLLQHALSMALDDKIEVELGFRWDKAEA